MPLFRHLWGGLVSPFRRTAPGLSTKVERLEPKQLLTTSLESISQGILGLDPITGEWTTVRYDGANYVTETADEINTIGHWSDSMSVDLDGNGLQEIYLRDTRTGDWWKVDPTATDPLPTWVSYWSPDVTIQKFFTGDLNGDGREDLLIFDQYGRWTTLAYDGTHYVTKTLSVWGTPDDWQDLTLADLNGDGAQDVVGFNSKTGVWWSISFQGDAFYTQPIMTWTTENAYDHFMVGDINGDNRDDLVAQDSLGLWWAVTFNGSTYSNQLLRGWNTDTTWQNFALTDTDGDGLDEVIAQDAQTCAWWAILHSPAGYYSQKLSTWNSDFTYTFLMVGDVTGDGRNDVVVQDNLGSWLALNFDGQSYQTTFLRGWDPETDWRYFRLTDVNADGVQEVVGWDSSSGKWWGIFKNGNSYINQQIGFWGPQSGYTDVHFGKYSTLPGSSVVGWNNQGGWWMSTLGISSQQNTFLASVEPRVNFAWTTLQDVNGDGLQDLVGWDAQAGDWRAIVRETTGTHNRFLGHLDPTVDWKYVTIADLDGDGRNDIAQWNPVTGKWWGLLSGSANPTTAVVLGTWQASSTYNHYLTGDINGDGRAELIVESASGGWFALGSNGTSFRTRRLLNWDPSLDWQDVGIADLDGDGADEIFARSGVTGDWWAIEWNGTAYQSIKLEHWNPASQYTNLMLGDVTGDGRVDIVQRDSIGNFWAITFNGTEYKSVFLWGWNTDTPWTNIALVDLDGNGTSEIVGCNAATLDWWAIFQGVGSCYTQQLVEGNLGLRADSVQAADLDGDGRQELIGLDQTTHTPWSLKLSDNVVQVQTLAAGVDWQNLHIGDIPGISDAMLRRQILLESPGLQTALDNGDTLQAATLILEWAARAGDFALDGSVLAPEANTVAEQYYNIFLNNLGGMSCGGYAAFYSGVLQLFGIDSLNIGAGNLPLISHTTVLIPILKDGTWNFYLFDPTFGATFRSLETGSLVSFFDLVDHVEAGTFDQIGINSISLDEREFLSPNPYTKPTVVFEGQNDLNYIYSWPGYGLEAYLWTCDKEMIASGFDVSPAGFMQLLMNHIYMVQAYGSTANIAMTAFLDQLTAYNIPHDA
ncbi:MAG: VCBS repeat-containing protein [Planctomycetales bacterium]